MPEPITDFEWYRDPAATGWAMLPAKEAQLSRRDAPGESDTVQVLPILNFTIEPAKIIRTGGRLEPYRPLQLGDSLFKRFSKIRKPEELLRFVEDFGPLTGRGRDPGGYEDVRSLLYHSHHMNEIIQAYIAGDSRAIVKAIGPKGMPLGDEGTIGQIHAKLVFEPGANSPRLKLNPTSLLNGIWMQLALWFENALTFGGKPRLANCLHCGDVFLRGEGHARRADAIFCSDRHRIDYNSQKRSRQIA